MTEKAEDENGDDDDGSDSSNGDEEDVITEIRFVPRDKASCE